MCLILPIVSQSWKLALAEVKIRKSNYELILKISIESQNKLEYESILEISSKSQNTSQH